VTARRVQLERLIFLRYAMVVGHAVILHLVGGDRQHLAATMKRITLTSRHEYKGSCNYGRNSGTHLLCKRQRERATLRRTRHLLAQAYADAMREVWKRFPNDVDAGALFAEAMMDLRPLNQWTLEGQPNPGAGDFP